MLVREKLGKDVKVNWTQQPRLIIIAQEFSPWDLAVVNEVKSPIELKKYTYYGEMLSIEDVNIIQTKIKGRMRETEKEEIEYTLDRHLKKATEKTKELFEELRRNILDLGDDVEENPTKWWIQYKAPIIFAGMMIHKNKIRIWIKIDEETLKDPKNIIRKMKWHPPHYFDLNSKEELSYAMELIKQAYLYVSS